MDNWSYGRILDRSLIVIIKLVVRLRDLKVPASKCIVDDAIENICLRVDKWLYNTSTGCKSTSIPVDESVLFFP